ncbi:RNA polymerase I termination factor [Gossypium arboreum]|uniref:RNA polymerase I termination factor n=1 Tax=Gossypium arboreum TaxID=29729 RepID=UPI0008190D35|nr:RNA polymerase I termination factor [Gossypium arboreum]
MGKKMREKDGHKSENKQTEEVNSIEKEIDVLNGVPKSSNRDDDKNKTKDRTKKRKTEFDTDKKESKNTHKKHKTSKDAVEEIPMETCLGGKENAEQESRKVMNLENNGEAKRVKKDKHKKNRDETDVVATVTETLKHSKKESEKAHKKHEKSKDEVKEISVENYLGGKKNTEQESSKAMNLENKGEAKRVGKDKHKKDDKDGINAVGIVTGTLEHSKKESPKARKKKKDVVEEISMETCLGGKDNAEKESSKVVNLGNNGEAEKVGEDKHKRKNKVGIDAVATVTETIEHSKMQEPVETDVCKKQKKKQKLEKVNGNVADDIAAPSSTTDKKGTGRENSSGNELERKKLRDIGGDDEEGNKRKKKKSKSVENDTDQVENATLKDNSKKVSFSDQVEVFPSMDDAKKDKQGLVKGKRFSKEEDEIVMNAVAEYIESHNLGDEGLNMVLNCGSHKEVRRCWNEIQAAIPWRPVESVYNRAHVLFERDEKRPWTPEEYEMVKKFVEKHGRNWRLLGDTLGKHRHHVKDTWRRISANAKKGQWSQDEYQKLFDLVNLDLCMKATQERKSKYGMLRDNICWTAIGNKMETRAFVSCCSKWYRNLTSPMVAEGLWADVDDYRMLDALSSLDACCMEDVNWDNILEHRSGDLCRKRWSQMVQRLGSNKNLSFAEQVDILAERYRPDMIEARETFDSKQPVDLP